MAVGQDLVLARVRDAPDRGPKVLALGLEAAPVEVVAAAMFDRAAAVREVELVERAAAVRRPSSCVIQRPVEIQHVEWNSPPTGARRPSSL